MKNKKKLSEEQQFAICFAAGIPMESEVVGNKLTLRTKHECAVIEENGKFKVIYRP